MRGRVRREPARRLLELPLAADGPVRGPAWYQRDRDVDEPLEEVALRGRRRAPRELELLVRLEKLAAADQLETASSAIRADIAPRH